jgi:hypothetical protein
VELKGSNADIALVEFLDPKLRLDAFSSFRSRCGVQLFVQSACLQHGALIGRFHGLPLEDFANQVKGR